MLLNFADNEIVFTAEDSMEVVYLRHIFDNDVRIIKNVKKSRNGFHITDDVEITVTLKKEENLNETV